MQIKDKKLGLAVLLALNVLAWPAVYDLSGPRFLEVNFFDVGQGDAIFIETPQRQQILIDGGPSSIILEKLAKEMPFWDRTIDLVILSHPERDHLAGLLEVLRRYKVENIVWTGVVRDTAEYQEWVKAIAKERTKIFIARAGQSIIMPRSVLGILYPTNDFEGKIMRDSNGSSIVARLDFGENSFLFTGDIRSFEEKEFLLRLADIDADVLKVAHHGSKTSSSDAFIKKVSPQIAVIQAGKNNSYGHPHQEVLETLEKYGINVFRTDQDGDIKIISDGSNYAVSHF